METSRELGGAIAIAVASTVLLGSRSGLPHGVHGGHGVIAAAAALGAVAMAFRAKSLARVAVADPAAIVEPAS